MAKLNCKCGEELTNQNTPNEIELKVYTDKEWDYIFDCDNIEPWRIPLPKYEVWKCPKCERIYVFDENNSRPVKIYNLDSRDS